METALDSIISFVRVRQLNIVVVAFLTGLYLIYQYWHVLTSSKNDEDSYGMRARSRSRSRSRSQRSIARPRSRSRSSNNCSKDKNRRRCDSARKSHHRRCSDCSECNQ